MKLIVLTLSFVIKCVITIENNLLYESEGDLRIGFVVEDCNILPQETTLTKTFVNSAIWITERINVLQISGPVTVGLTVFKVCTEYDFYNSIFTLFQQQQKDFLLGIVTVDPLPQSIRDFSNVLNIHVKTVNRSWQLLVRASVELLSALKWKENVTVISQFPSVLGEFYKFARREWICVKHVQSMQETKLSTNQINSPIIVFGDKDGIDVTVNTFVYQQNLYGLKIIFVPLDGSPIDGLPDDSYIIQPMHAESFQRYAKSPKIIPTPLLLDLASPIISYTRNVTNFIAEHCNGTTYKLNCLRNKFKSTFSYEVYSNKALISLLKIEPLANKFTYNIYHVENLTLSENVTRELRVLKNVFQSLNKVYTYNIFDESFINLDDFLSDDNFTNATYLEDCSKAINRCIFECLNFNSMAKKDVLPFTSTLVARSESWVFAFMSISILGVIFCLAIIIFIAVRIWQKYVFEGNPTLTIMLLFIVMTMYCCIIPFALDGDVAIRPSIYLARSLSVTLPYAGAFSLLLSRAILLATISKEVGFMSHVAGTIQSFLCLFIFGVQCALSLQVIRRCEDLFHDFLIIYLLSYNIILLVLLLCLCPLIVKSQRNYKEGRYFTVATVLIVCNWCCWVPAYVVLPEEWKDPMLCLGLVSTASILIGALFIPRTYLMTVAAARDRFTSALPSLATATSAMDIYRASTQPLYDCVNVATVNAINARNGGTQATGHQDLYSCPAVPDDDFDIQCDTPTNPDKVTRF